MSDQSLMPRIKFASLIAVPTRTFDRMQSAGLLPRPVAIGGKTKRWSRAEVDGWIAAGCPPRAKWDAIKTRFLKAHN